jgi:hypothetical protein
MHSLAQGIAEQLHTSLGTAAHSIAVGTPDGSTALLLFITSLAFLAPARAAFNLGRLWHAWVFLLMAVVCAADHVCNSDLHPQLGPAGEILSQWLALAHHGWSYFCFLQVAFLVLGPEDPHLQWIDHPVAHDMPKSSLPMAAPLHAIVLARLLPIGAIALFLCCFSSQEDFSWQFFILTEVLLLFVCAAFWMHRDRRSSMPKVLLRMRFWRRLWNYCALPGLLTAFIWVLTESADSKVVQAFLPVLLAVLATRVIHVVYDSNGDLNNEAPIMNVSPQNQVIARFLLGSTALFGLPTLIVSLLLDWWSVGFWRWPMVCMSTRLRPSGYFAIIGFLPTFMAQAVAFRLIRSTSSNMSDNTEEIVLSKQLGCMIGYTSVLFGLLTLALPQPVFPYLHTFCVIAFLCLMMVAVVLTTLSARQPLAAGARTRFVLMLAIFTSVMVFLTLLILVQQLIPNTYGIPYPLLAAVEYVTLALPMLWPTTWGFEVQARWQTHKAWHTFRSNQMA